MFARFGVSPSPPTAVPANIRVRLGSTVIATKNNVSVSGGSIIINDIAVTEVLESTIKVTTPTFTWEITFDGSTWEAIGDSGPHKIYWIFGDPIIPPFKASPSGTEFNPLYDRALEKAVGYADGSVATGESAKSEIIGKLNTGVETDVVYESTAGGFQNTHPLNIYGVSGPLCQCSEAANLLRGLMRSIGIDGTTKFFWSGDANTGTRWGFTYPGDTRFLPTFRVIRSAKDEVAENPHFVFHAAVLAEGKYWDPSYGTNYTSLVFDEVSNYPDPGFTTGNSKQVIRDALGSLIDQLNTNRTCPHTQ